MQGSSVRPAPAPVARRRRGRCVALALTLAACGATDDAPAPAAAAKPAPAADPEPVLAQPTPLADLAAIDAHLAAAPHSPEGHLARLTYHLERGDYEEAQRALNISLYSLAQADALPPEATWLPVLERHYPRPSRAAEGARLLAMLDDFYARSPTIDALHLDYLVAARSHEHALQLAVKLALHKYPGDPRWSARLEALRAQP
ncbi:MAG: hypothetical protein R3A79_30260 [Nannocystaceae bacterium]